MDKLKELWKKADGKKTVAGVCLVIIAVAFEFTGLITEDQASVVFDIGALVAGLGVTHKVIKFLR